VLRSRKCAARRTSRSTYLYEHRRPEQASLRKRIRELSEARVRYGYRRIHVLLRREGWTINHKQTRRLYREEGLQLRRKTPKRKVSAKRREGRIEEAGCGPLADKAMLQDVVKRKL
jgi:putative transposase